MPNAEPTGSPAAAVTPRPVRGRWGRRLGILLVLAAAAIVIAPWIIAATPARDVVFHLFVNDWPGPVFVRHARLGWWTPPSFEDCRLVSRDGSGEVKIARFVCDEPLWKFALRIGYLGHIRVEGLSSSMTVPKDWAPDPPRRPVPPPKTIWADVSIPDATFQFRGPAGGDEWTRVDDVSVALTLRPSHDGFQQILVHPGPILKNVPVTPVLADAGLKFVAPVLANATWSRGSFSLELDEGAIEPDRIDQSRAKGRFLLHSIEAGGKSPLVREIVDAIRTALPVEIPRSVKLTENSVVEFEVSDGGVRHDSLAFGFPDALPNLVIRTSGWIGFDQTLDMVAEIPLPVRPDATNRIAASLAGTVLRLPITGTIEKPKVELAKAGGQAGIEILARLVRGAPTDDQAAAEMIESLRGIGAIVKESLARPRPEGSPPPLAEKMITNGLPKVGKAAEKLLKGLGNLERRLEGKGAAESKGDEVPLKERKGALKKAVRRLLEKALEPIEPLPGDAGSKGDGKAD